jgi:hypothetical protein
MNSTPLPHDIALEICELSPSAKALLMNELTDEIAEKIEGFEVPNLSATTTQWLKALSVAEALKIIQELSIQLLLDVNK